MTTKHTCTYSELGHLGEYNCVVCQQIKQKVVIKEGKIETNLEMNPKIKKEWDKFIEWLYKAHSITKDWMPDYYSIKLWEEYKDGNKHIRKVRS